MTKKINKNNILPFKHYFYVIAGVIVVILLIWYGFSWYQAIKKERLDKSYLITSNTINLELNEGKEITYSLQETPNEYFVFISYTGDEKEYNLEKKLKRIIDNYNIADKFYYINVTDKIKNNNLMSYLNKSFNTDLISSIPCILYYEDGKLNTVIQNNTDMVDAKEFQKLLETIENKTQ